MDTRRKRKTLQKKDGLCCEVSGHPNVPDMQNCTGGSHNVDRLNLKDFVQIDPENVGIIVGISQTIVHILDNHGQVIERNLGSTFKITRNRKGVSMDVNRNFIRPNDKVKVFGDNGHVKIAQADVLLVHKKSVFLHSPLFTENSGFFVCNSKQMELLSGRSSPLIDESNAILKLKVSPIKMTPKRPRGRPKKIPKVKPPTKTTKQPTGNPGFPKWIQKLKQSKIRPGTRGQPKTRFEPIHIVGERMSRFGIDSLLLVEFHDPDKFYMWIGKTKFIMNGWECLVMRWEEEKLRDGIGVEPHKTSKYSQLYGPRIKSVTPKRKLKTNDGKKSDKMNHHDEVQDNIVHLETSQNIEDGVNQQEEEEEDIQSPGSSVGSNQFHKDYCDAISWIEKMKESMVSTILPSDIAGAQELIDKHLQVKKEMDLKKIRFDLITAQGNSLPERVIGDPTNVHDLLQTLKDKERDLENQWEEKMVVYNQCKDLIVFYSDIERANANMKTLELHLESTDLGESIHSAQELLSIHEDFENSKMKDLKDNVTTLEKRATSMIECQHYAVGDVVIKKDLLLQRFKSLLEMSGRLQKTLDANLKFLLFEKDCNEMKGWINHKLDSEAEDDCMLDSTIDIIAKTEQNDMLKKDLLVRKANMEKIFEKGRNIDHHFLSCDSFMINQQIDKIVQLMTALEDALHLKDETLSKASAKLNFMQLIGEAETWISQVEQELTCIQVGSDIISVQKAQKELHFIEEKAHEYKEKIAVIKNTAEAEYADEDCINRRANTLKIRFSALTKTAESRKNSIVNDMKFYLFCQEVEQFDLLLLNSEYWKDSGLIGNFGIAEDTTEQYKELFKRVSSLEEKISHLQEESNRLQSILYDRAPMISQKMKDLSCKWILKKDRLRQQAETLQKTAKEITWIRESMKRLLPENWDSTVTEIENVEELMVLHQKLDLDIKSHESAVVSLIGGIEKRVSTVENDPIVASNLTTLRKMWSELEGRCSNQRERLDCMKSYHKLLSNVKVEEAWIIKTRQQFNALANESGENLAAAMELIKKHEALEDELKVHKEQLAELNNEASASNFPSNHLQSLKQLIERLSSLQKDVHDLENLICKQKHKISDDLEYYQFIGKTEVVEKWITEKKDFVKGMPTSCQDIRTLQELIKEHKSFNVKLKTVMKTDIAQLRSLKNQFMESGNVHVSEITRRFEGMRKELLRLCLDADTRKRNLFKLLEQLERNKDEGRLQNNNAKIVTSNIQQAPINIQKQVLAGNKARQSPKKLNIEDFAIFDVLGEGGFGKVYLGGLKGTNDKLAIKAIKKSDAKNFIVERNVMIFGTCHPFLTSLHSCFQTEGRIFFVMEYYNRGDLDGYLNNKLPYPVINFITAQMVLALQFLHVNGIVHRDVKPENILIDNHGYCRLGDYGICREGLLDGVKSRERWGTIPYMAPELIQEKEYTFSVDWWSLGVVVFYMATHTYPFPSTSEEHRDVVFKRICNNKLPDIKQFKPEEKILIHGLLTKEPSLRLGCKAGDEDGEEIKQLEYFDRMNWIALEKKLIVPPSTKFTCDIPPLQTSANLKLSRTPNDGVQVHEPNDKFKDFCFVNEAFNPSGWNPRVRVSVPRRYQPKIMVFRPNAEQFENFSEYINFMESMGAHEAGIAKVIPPADYRPRKNGYNDIGDIKIKGPLCQTVTGGLGLYQIHNEQKKNTTVAQFRKLAESDEFKTPPHLNYDDLKCTFWQNITEGEPIYGADVIKSITDDDVNTWNINKLDTILDLLPKNGIKIDGVNTAYLYFGMWKTQFVWHCEDKDLYSINYLHFGQPKTWYSIPPAHGKSFERLASDKFPVEAMNCPAFLRHKSTIISPEILTKHKIPFDTITQEPGEFIVTFPYGYHCGFNHGFNCAESTNFATARWIDYGKLAKECYCGIPAVRIPMNVFVENLQEERYDAWTNGVEIMQHPEEKDIFRYAPSPDELLKLEQNDDSTDRKARKKRK